MPKTDNESTKAGYTSGVRRDVGEISRFGRFNTSRARFKGRDTFHRQMPKQQRRAATQIYADIVQRGYFPNDTGVWDRIIRGTARRVNFIAGTLAYTLIFFRCFLLTQ